MKKLLCKGISRYLIVAMFVIGVTPPVYAGFAPSEGLVLAPEERTADLGRIQKFLDENGPGTVKRSGVYLIINNRADGNASLIAQKITGRLHSEKQQGLF